MSENINSEALDRLFEIDGQLYGAPSIIRMARIRASILHASAAWGSDADGVLIGQLADRVENLWESLRWALAELNGKTRYDNDEQRENCFALTEAALASVQSDQVAPRQSDKPGQVADAIDWLRKHIAEVDDDNSYWGGPHRREYLSAPEILKELVARAGDPA